jgi:hypothetical protein
MVDREKLDRMWSRAEITSCPFRMLGLMPMAMCLYEFRFKLSLETGPFVNCAG